MLAVADVPVLLDEPVVADDWLDGLLVVADDWLDGLLVVADDGLDGLAVDDDRLEGLVLDEDWLDELCADAVVANANPAAATPMRSAFIFLCLLCWADEPYEAPS